MTTKSYYIIEFDHETGEFSLGDTRDRFPNGPLLEDGIERTLSEVSDKDYALFETASELL